jgi:hypothetical protein
MKQKQNIPHFQAVLLPETAADFKISLVRRPAIQRKFIALSADEVTPAAYTKLALSAAQQVVTGPVLIPDLPIKRTHPDGTHYYVSFSESTIAQLSRSSLKQLPTVTDEHQKPVKEAVLIESWLIADSNCDKAVQLGLSDLLKGTWMASYHIPDAAYWEKEIASGAKQGFSIEGLFELLPHPEAEIMLSEEPSLPAEETKTTWLALSEKLKSAWQKLLLSFQENKESVVANSDTKGLVITSEELTALIALQSDALAVFDEQIKVWALRWGSIDEQLTEVQKQITLLQQAPAAQSVETLPTVEPDTSLAARIAHQLQYLPEEV